MSRRPRRTALLIALPLLLAGCASAGAEPKPGTASPSRTDPVPSVSAVPALDSANDRPLPLDGYLLNYEQQTQVEQAQAKLVTACMTRLGFTFAFPASPRELRGSDAPTTRIDGRYGPQNAATMATWGYHPEGGVPAEKMQPRSAPAPKSREETIAQTGSSDPKQRFGPGGQLVNGRKVPDHGCFGEANQRLTGAVDGQIGDPQTAVTLKFRTLSESQQDTRTRAAFARWSQCMKGSGFDYPDPVAAMGDPEWNRTPMPTPHEIRVAEADAGCRHEHNVVGIWYAVDYAYQQEAIAAEGKAMAEAKAGLETQVRAARQVLAS
ncbi:hypothetical protein [Kitasatospora arboriphila]|uniref:Uncharacterized protein n=1 Tax=Kitasatospora arboriphila TaxID=258052 RepID=A0ABN1TB44_9ACTN